MILHGDSLSLFMALLASFITGILLIGFLLPYFLVPGIFVFLVFHWAALWYRPCAREIKASISNTGMFPWR